MTILILSVVVMVANRQKLKEQSGMRRVLVQAHFQFVEDTVFLGDLSHYRFQLLSPVGNRVMAEFTLLDSGSRKPSVAVSRIVAARYRARLAHLYQKQYTRQLTVNGQEIFQIFNDEIYQVQFKQ